MIRDMPRCLKKPIWLSVLAVTLSCGALFGVLILTVWFGAPQTIALGVLFLIAIVLMPIWLLYVGLYMLRVEERVGVTRGRSCPVCVYDLRGLPDESGKCPECGTSYTRESLARAWRWHVRRPPCVVRSNRGYVVGLSLVFLLIMLGPVVPLLPVMTPRWHMPLGPIFPVIVIAFLVWVGVRSCRLRRRVRSARWHICPMCGTDLCGVPAEAGSCPKCGEPYTRESLHEAWRCFAKGS